MLASLAVSRSLAGAKSQAMLLDVPTMRPRKEPAGWTIIELLIVLAILAILIGLLLAAIQKVRESAAIVSCQHNLKDLVLAVHTYHQDHHTMPPYASGRAGEIFGSWYIHLLPYVGNMAMYETIRAGSEASDGGVTVAGPGIALAGIRDAVFPHLLCPSDPNGTREGRTNYLANWFAFSDGSNGIYSPPRKFAVLTDGLSNVVLFAEGYRECDGLPRLALLSAHHHNFGVTQEGKASDDPEYAPEDYTMFQVQPALCDKWRSQTPHQTMNVGMAAGEVRTVSSGVSLTAWKALLKPQDGAVVPNEHQ